MKKIKPIQIWVDGKNVNGTVLNLKVVQDNLKDTATFYYSILDDKLNKLTEGNLTMRGDDYDKYSTNEDAFNYAAFALSLELNGDFIM